MSLALVTEELGGELLLQAIDEVLESFFGRSVRTQIYRFLEKRFMLTRNEIPTSLELFSETIYTLFGQVSKQIELKILESFHKRLGTELEQENSSLIPKFSRIVEAQPTRASTIP